MVNRKSAFNDGDARAAWNKGARAWEEFVESGADYYRRDFHGPALLQICGTVNGQEALDLGCGQGYFSREIARLGAHVVGIDISERLISYAKMHEEKEPLGITYNVMSAAEVNNYYSSSAFDLIVACMSLQDMADVEEVFGNVHEILRDRGRMVFSVPHPFTDTNFRQWEINEVGEKVALKVDRYFESGTGVCHWNMRRIHSPWDTPYWRFTLEEWSELIAKAGFCIKRLYEPRPSEEQVQKHPKFRDCYRVPYFLLFDLVKC